MNVTWSSRHTLICFLTMPVVLDGCATVQGYPRDPGAIRPVPATKTESDDAFNGTDEKSYADATDEAGRRSLRDRVISARLRGYDIAYANFERQLLGTGNSISTGSDLVALALGGLTATVGGTATKAALGAAVTGIVGANAAINKDLFYQKTIPALISQMDANRAIALRVILQGMGQPTTAYSLTAALAGLNAYRDAGSLPNAITSITQTASEAKQNAEENVNATFVRGADYWTNLPTAESIEDKIHTLNDLQLLAVMKFMDTKLASRELDLQKTIKTAETRETDPRVAKTVLSMWAINDDMTGDRAKEWNDAINDALNTNP